MSWSSVSEFPVCVIRQRTPLLAAVGIDPQPSPVKDSTVASAIQFGSLCDVVRVTLVIGVGMVGDDEGISEQAARSTTARSGTRYFIAPLSVWLQYNSLTDE